MMTRFVIGVAISGAVLSTAACGGSATSPSATLSPVSPSTATSFAAQSFTASPPSVGTLSHDHGVESDHADHSTAPDREDQLEGRILSINVAARTFVVRTTTVSVPAAAIIRHGQTTIAFADLKAGDEVHVKGTASASGVVATDVIVQAEDNDNENDDDAQGVRIAGAVAAVTPGCPVITFTLGTMTVSTDASTRFQHGSCEQIVNGVTVEVRGATQTNGSILATRVTVSREGHGGGDDD